MKPIQTKSIAMALICAACLTCGNPLVSQDAEPQRTAVERRLTQKYWELWRTGFQEYEAGEVALIGGRNEEAAEYYKKALKAFQTVKKNNPNWNKNVINYRISLVGKRLKTALRRIDYQKNETPAVPAAGSANQPVAVPPRTPSDPAAEIEALRIALTASESKNAPLRKEAEQGRLAMQQIPGLIAEKKEAEGKYAALLTQYEELKKKADSAAAAGNPELEKALKEEKFRSETLTEAVNSLRKETASLKSAVIEKEKQLKDITASLRTANSKLDEKSGLDQKQLKEIQTLTAENGRLKQQLTVLEGEIKKISVSEAAAAKLASEVAELKKSLADAQNKPVPEPVRVENPVNKELEARVKTLTAEAEALRKSLENAKTIPQDADAAKLTDLYNQSRTEAENAKAEKVKIAEEYRKLKTSYDSLDGTLETALNEKNKLADEVRKLNKDLLNIQALLEKAKLEAEDDSKVVAAQKAGDEWKQKFENAQKSADDLKNELEKAKTASGDRQKQIAELQAVRDELQLKYQRAAKRLEGWESGTATVPRETLDQKNKVIDQLMEEHKKLSQEIMTLKSSLEDEKTNAARLRKTLTLSRDVTEKAIAEARSLRAEVDMYRSKDPNPRPAVVVKVQEVPEEIKNLTAVENDKVSRANAADSKKYDACMKAGKDAFDAENYEDALWQFYAAADADPEKAAPYLAIAQIHIVRNNPEQGLKTYEKALRLGAERMPGVESKLKEMMEAKNEQKEGK